MDEERERSAKAYYAKLEEFGKNANIGTTIGCAYTPKVAAKLIKKYLEFRGYKLPRTVTLEYVAMILMELDTKDERVRCGLSLMVRDMATSPKLD